jgi:hypothetical protein
LCFIQKNLKVPKFNYNNFGKYHYRSAEDIKEALKSIMPEGVTFITRNDISIVGERYYVKVYATLEYKGKTVETFAFSREDESKKGMDASQLTAATSAYATKLAMDCLFLLDDTKASDETSKTTKKQMDDEEAKKHVSGARNADDAKAANALGGSIREGMDAETVKTMYEQGIKNLTCCMDTDQLKKAWTPLYKGRSVFSESQWQDLEDAKEATKIEIENTSPHM